MYMYIEPIEWVRVRCTYTVGVNSGNRMGEVRSVRERQWQLWGTRSLSRPLPVVIVMIVEDNTQPLLSWSCQTHPAALPHAQRWLEAAGATSLVERGMNVCVCMRASLVERGMNVCVYLYMVAGKSADMI